MGVLVAVGGFVLYQALTSARVYFLNVDEAVARRTDLADSAFNMQGTVIKEPSSASDGAMLFTMTFGGEDVEVRHIGDEPTDLFKVGERVVAKGHWEGDVFISDQLLIKHSEEYVEDNPDRVNYEVDDSPTSSSNGQSDADAEASDGK